MKKKFIYQCKECGVFTESDVKLPIRIEREFSGTIEYKPKRYWKCLVCSGRNYIPKEE